MYVCICFNFRDMASLKLWHPMPYISCVRDRFLSKTIWKRDTFLRLSETLASTTTYVYVSNLMYICTTSLLEVDVGKYTCVCIVLHMYWVFTCRKLQDSTKSKPDDVQRLLQTKVRILICVHEITCVHSSITDNLLSGVWGTAYQASPRTGNLGND